MMGFGIRECGDDGQQRRRAPARAPRGVFRGMRARQPVVERPALWVAHAQCAPVTAARPSMIRKTVYLLLALDIRHLLVGLLRQSVFGRLAGYKDANDAERLSHDPVMCAIVDRNRARAPQIQFDPLAKDVRL